MIMSIIFNGRSSCIETFCRLVNTIPVFYSFTVSKRNQNRPNLSIIFNEKIKNVVISEIKVQYPKFYSFCFHI